MSSAAASRRVGAVMGHVRPRGDDDDGGDSSTTTPSGTTTSRGNDARVGLMDWMFGATGIGGKRASFTVAVLGAAGGIGQSLSCFVK